MDKLRYNHHRPKGTAKGSRSTGFLPHLARCLPVRIVSLPVFPVAR